MGSKQLFEKLQMISFPIEGKKGLPINYVEINKALEIFINEYKKIYEELNELIESPDESEIIKINAGKWNLYWVRKDRGF